VSPPGLGAFFCGTAPAVPAVFRFTTVVAIAEVTVDDAGSATATRAEAEATGGCCEGVALTIAAVAGGSMALAEGEVMAAAGLDRNEPAAARPAITPTESPAAISHDQRESQRLTSGPWDTEAMRGRTDRSGTEACDNLGGGTEGLCSTDSERLSISATREASRCSPAAAMPSIHSATSRCVTTGKAFSQAAAMSRAVWNRSFGSFASALSTTASSSGESPSTFVLGAGTSAAMIL